MPRPRMKMEKIREILRQSEKGISKREMERSIGVSRPVITEYLNLFKQAQITYNQIEDITDDTLCGILFPDTKSVPEKKKNLFVNFPEYAKELKRTGVSLQLLWEEYKRKEADCYSYSQFCFHFQVWKEQLEISMHQEMKAGDKLFIDYAGKKLRITDKETGKESEVEVFVSILGASQLIYVDASLHQKQDDVIRSTENCLHYYGGVPKAIVPDCMKTAVTKANKYEPEINPAFADFAKHYDTVIFPARPASPRDKSLVENAVRIVYGRIYAPLRNQTFYSLEDLNASIRVELENLNSMPMQKLKISRRQLFDEIEKEVLAPLANHKYVLRKIITVKAHLNYHVYLAEDKRYYSVPYKLRGNRIKVYYTDTAVEMIYNNERVAIHARVKSRGFSTNQDHMASPHKFYSDWNPERIQELADDVGQYVKETVIKVMNQSKYPEQGYKACVGIIGLATKYGKEKLNQACRKAIYFKAFRYNFIKNLLVNNNQEIEEEQPSLFPDLNHENIRGSAYYF